jgi:glyoxylase-like metal-dependent hydrolase (beta-lactamase superfamily II)
MRATAHGDHLITLTRLGWVNAHLVREDDGLTLVDTTLGGGAKALLEQAQRAHGPITRIALTHAHGDHVGSVDALHSELPDVEVAIGARDAPFLKGDKSLRPGEPDAKPRGGFPRIDTEPTRLLAAGERVGSLEVVPAPGHTPGQIAYLDTRDRTLIVGDAFQTLGGVAVAGVVRPLFPLPAMATWHRPTAVESARRLLELRPARLAVGHGRTLEAPEAAMREAIAVAERKA